MSLAMQTRCVRCMGEQYAPRVIGFSYGLYPCGQCDRVTAPMTDEQGRAILRARFQGHGPHEKAFTCIQCAHTPVTDLDELLTHLRDAHPPTPSEEDDDDDF